MLLQYSEPKSKLSQTDATFHCVCVCEREGSALNNAPPPRMSKMDIWPWNQERNILHSVCLILSITVIQPLDTLWSCLTENNPTNNNKKRTICYETNKRMNFASKSVKQSFSVLYFCSKERGIAINSEDIFILYLKCVCVSEAIWFRNGRRKITIKCDWVETGFYRVQSRSPIRFSWNARMILKSIPLNIY